MLREESGAIIPRKNRKGVQREAERQAGKRARKEAFALKSTRGVDMCRPNIPKGGEV